MNRSVGSVQQQCWAPEPRWGWTDKIMADDLMENLIEQIQFILVIFWILPKKCNIDEVTSKLFDEVGSGSFFLFSSKISTPQKSLFFNPMNKVNWSGLNTCKIPHLTPFSPHTLCFSVTCGSTRSFSQWIWTRWLCPTWGRTVPRSDLCLLERVGPGTFLEVTWWSFTCFRPVFSITTAFAVGIILIYNTEGSICPPCLII